MPRIAWIVLSVAAALLAVGFAGAAFVVASGSGSEAAGPETTLTLGESGGQVQLPLADQDQTLMLAQYKGRVLVGIAASAGGPVDVAVLEGETPVAPEKLSFAADGKPVDGVPCGRTCFRLAVGPSTARAGSP